MNSILIKNALVINEEKKEKLHVLIKNEFIDKISKDPIDCEGAQVIDAEGRLLLPGVIDDQVHFRDPGLTHKADLTTESKAAIAGGVTSFMEMPNTIPQTTNLEELQRKFDSAENRSFANYSFYFGATNHNLALLKKIDPAKVCGVKVFMGSSTGDMLVDNENALAAIFAESPVLVATHSEDEQTIQNNLILYREKYGENIPVRYHPKIRSEEACYKSSSHAVELAIKYGTKLHILHLSTAKELSLFETKPLADKKITGEVCVHHLWFNDHDYEKLGTRIKWNPAIKTRKDQESLLEGLRTDKLDVIATDHAPHLLNEKHQVYTKAPSGGPLVQHSLVAMLELWKKGQFDITDIVRKMSHAPATLFNIEKRGFIREGYYGDLVLVNPTKGWEVNKDNVLYKCKWSPFEGQFFSAAVEKTFLNGHLVYDQGTFKTELKGKALKFNR